MIPPVSADKIAEAMQQFDTQLRNTQEWANWDQNQVHKYAIEHHDIRYPVKQVVSLATVIPVSDFSGGEGAGQANQYVMQLGFKVVRHGRYITFQLAEVAIPRRLFAEILRLIDGLRPKAAPT